LAQFMIDLEWKRHAAGYRIVPERPPQPPRQSRPPPTIAEIDCGTPERIAGIGGALKSYRPLAKSPELFRPFVGIARDAPGLLRFVNDYGPLTDAGVNGPGEDVPLLLKTASTMRDFLSTSERIGRKRLSEVPAGLFTGVDLSRLTAQLKLDIESGELQFSLRPRSLLDAMWVQLGQALARAGVFRTCRFCGQIFEAGGRGERDRRAIFCSEDHKKQFHSLERSRK